MRKPLWSWNGLLGQLGYSARRRARSGLERRGRRLNIETLEARVLLAASVTPNDQDLYAQTAVVSAAQPDAKPLSVSISTASCVEGDNLAFAVNLSAPSKDAVTVKYRTGSATADQSDYTPAQGELVFQPGQTEQTIAVRTADDRLEEGDEHFVTILSDAAGAGIARGTAVGTVLDNDRIPLVAIHDATAAAGEQMSFLVSLSNPYRESVTVNYALVDGIAKAGVDFQSGDGTLSFGPGETITWLKVPTFSRPAIDAAQRDFRVALKPTLPPNYALETTDAVGTIAPAAKGATSPSSSDTGSATGGGGMAVLSGGPTVSVGDASANEGQWEYFSVSLSAPASAGASVHWRTVDGTAKFGSPDYDYYSAGGWIAFSIGQSVASIAVPTRDDTLDEGDEHFSVVLDGFVNLSPGRTTGNGTIIDNDLPSISIGDSSAREEAGNMIFTVTLSNLSVFNIGVSYYTQDGTATAGQDYTARSGQATVIAGSVAAAIYVPITDDYLAENDEDFQVVLTGASRGTIVDNSATGTILDNDRWWVRIDAVDDTAIEPRTPAGQGDPGQFRVTRYDATDRRYALAVDYVVWGAATYGVDYSPWPDTVYDPEYHVYRGTVTIPANQDSTVLDVTPLYDGEQGEPPEDVTVTLADAAQGPGGVPRYTLGWPWSGMVTILDPWVDLDIDSNNDSIIDEADDPVEDITGDDSHPGKVILVSNVDSDADGILDWVDGFNWREGDSADDWSIGTSFAPLQLSLPNWLDLNTTVVELSYDDSDPGIYRPGDVLGKHFVRPDDGALRIWNTDSFCPRNPDPVDSGGNFVPSGTYTASELGMSLSPYTVLFVEAENPSIATADKAITLRVSGGGLPAGIVVEDRVRVTTTLIEIIADSQIEGIPPFEVWGFEAARLPTWDAIEDDGLLNDFLQTYTINVYDPRGGISQLTVDEQPVPLVRSGSGYTSANPVVVVRQTELPLLQVNQRIDVQYDHIRQYRYKGFFTPDDPFANPVPWAVARDGTATATADLDQGLLLVDTLGSNAAYSAQLTDPELWAPGADVTLELRFRMLTHDPINGPDGAFRVVLGDGVREWRIGLLPDRLVTCENGVRVETPLPSSLLDVTFHAIGFQRTAGQGYAQILVDGAPVMVSVGTASGFQGILWGDPGAGISGRVEYDYLDWEHPPVPQPPLLSQSPSDVVGSCTVIALDNYAEPVLHYNPGQRSTRLIYSDLARGADETVADAVQKAVNELEQEGWRAPNPNDAGAWGKAVHDRVQARLKGNERFRSGVLLETQQGTNRIKATSAPGGIAGHTQLDVVYLQPGYKPQVGDILDGSRCIIYEIKASASGQIPAEQLTRLRQIQGGDIRRVWTRLKWSQATNTLVPNNRYLRQVDTVNSMGLKKVGAVMATVAVVVGFTQVDDAYAAFEQELYKLKNVRNPDTIALQEAAVLLKLKDLIDCLSGGTTADASNAMYLAYIYRRLIPRMADPYWHND